MGPPCSNHGEKETLLWIAHITTLRSILQFEKNTGIRTSFHMQSMMIRAGNLKVKGKFWSDKHIDYNCYTSMIKIWTSTHTHIGYDILHSWHGIGYVWWTIIMVYAIVLRSIDPCKLELVRNMGHIILWCWYKTMV